jgi:hypothetical protein
LGQLLPPRYPLVIPKTLAKTVRHRTQIRSGGRNGGGKSSGGRNGGGQNGGVQAIRIQCDVGQVNNVDPIVMPGMAGVAITISSLAIARPMKTPPRLRCSANRPDTCRNRADFSAIWAPQLWQGSTAIAPKSMTVLYAKTVTSAVIAHPAGMVLIAGNAKATERQDLSVVSWYCGNNVQNAAATPQSAPATKTWSV